MSHSKYETREVLAAAYRGRKFSKEEVFLTHMVIIDCDGNDSRTACRQPLENLADPLSGDVSARPTCKTCGTKWDREKIIEAKWKAAFGTQSAKGNDPKGTLPK